MEFLLILFLTMGWGTCYGYLISQCGSDGKVDLDETGSAYLTCTGIKDETVKWTFKRNDGTTLNIGACTWSNSSCSTDIAVYELNRTDYNTSTLTVTRNHRGSIAGTVICWGIPNSGSARCKVRVVSFTTTTTTTQTTTTSTTATETPSSTALPPSPTTTCDTKTTDQNTERNDDDDDDDDDDDGLPIPVIAGGAGGGLLVIIAVVIAIVVWKKRCDPTYARPTRRSQVIDTNIYTGLELQQRDSTDQAPEEDVYEDTTGHQPAGHGTVEYVNTATGTQAAEGTVYVDAFSSV